jgi:NADH-quinone oxidoreductase subunit I
MLIRFLKNIFLVDLLKGMWLTLKYTPQPAFTFQYPAERRPTAPRFRGVLRLQTEPATGAQTCIVCDQCAKACPDDLIALGGREPGQKIKILDYFDFNLSLRFCMCAEVCPTKPISAHASEDYELGSYSRDTQILRVDQMYDGVPIEQYLAEQFSLPKASGGA